MKRGGLLLIGALAAAWLVSGAWMGGATSHAHASAERHDRTRAHVVTRDTHVAPEPRRQVEQRGLTPHQWRDASTQIVQRRVVAPAATVSRELSEQPVLPHLAEVLVGSRFQAHGPGVPLRIPRPSTQIRVFVDPEQDLGHLDRGHHLRRAQVRHSHWLSRQAAQPARVIRNPQRDAREASGEETVRPRAILRVPEVPRPKRDGGPSMVRTE